MPKVTNIGSSFFKLRKKIQQIFFSQRHAAVLPNSYGLNIIIINITIDATH